MEKPRRVLENKLKHYYSLDDENEKAKTQNRKVNERINLSEIEEKIDDVSEHEEEDIDSEND